MGAWGIGIFDNDDAADWVWGLQDEGLHAAQRALQAAAAGGEVDASVGAEALAAAAVVVALTTGSAELLEGSPEAAEWVAAHQDAESRPLLGTVVAALDAVLADGSELDELWSETDEHDDWRATVGQLRNLASTT